MSKKLKLKATPSRIKIEPYKTKPMIDIRIRSLELTDTETLTGVVSQVKTVVTVDGTSMFQTFTLDATNPANHVPLDQVDDTIVKGWLKPALKAQIPQIKDQVARQNAQKMDKAIKVIDPQTGAVSYSRQDHIKSWEPDVAYVKDDKFYYEWQTTEGEGEDEIVTDHKEFYTVIQPHTSQANWLPTETAALYTSMFIFEGEYPQWKMPQGAHDAWPLGIQVEKNEIVYESLIDANTTDPETSPEFWLRITPEEEPGGEYPAWEVWSGLNEDLHMTGDRVTHIDKVWESDVDNNHYEPPTQWTEVIL